MKTKYADRVKTQICPLCRNNMILKKVPSEIKGCFIYRKVCLGTDQHWITLEEDRKWRNREVTSAQIKAEMRERARASQDGRLRKWFG